MSNFYIIEKSQNPEVFVWPFVVTFALGFLAYMIQRIADRLIFDPLNKQREVMEQISVVLIKYANFYSNPLSKEPWGDILYTDKDRKELVVRDYERASTEVRELSAKLRSSINNVPFQNFLYRVKIIKINREDLLSSAGLLMGLSNSFFLSDRGVENSMIADNVREKLKIKID
jgi:hypothetical protein